MRRDGIWKAIMAALASAVSLASSAEDLPPLGGLGPLPPAIASAFQQAALPSVGSSDAIDLDADGIPEVVLFSHAPIVVWSATAAAENVAYQSLLLVFRRVENQAEAFPYRLSTTKTLVGSVPKPAFLAVRDMGGDPRPELAWLEGGPDLEGRYHEAVLFNYDPNSEPKLIEVGRFSELDGWVRVHDLDGDGSAEIVGFISIDGKTVCPNLLFSTGSGWRTLEGEILRLGSPDIKTFQAAHSLEPTGRVTKELLIAVKKDLDMSPIQVDSVEAPGDESAP
jgi:hypothetical protein